MQTSYFALASKMALLAFEAQQVITLRMLRLAAGGTLASREWQRMITEKTQAAQVIGVASALSLASGRPNAAIASDIVRGYRARVNRNRRRLTSR